MPRDSVDYRRASTAQSATVQQTYGRFHAFIDLQIEQLRSHNTLLDVLLIDTLDGIKRQSTVSLFNLFIKSGKLSEEDNEEAGL